MTFFQVPQPRVENLFNAPEFSAPSILQRRFELTDTTIEKGSKEAIEDNVQDDRNANREIKLLVGH